MGEPQKLKIMVGEHTSSRWTPIELTWPEMMIRLVDYSPTAETEAEWNAWKAQGGDDAHVRMVTAKGSRGAWVGGSNEQGSRRKADLVERQVLALDIDEPRADMFDRAEALGVALVAHQTHTPGRWRVVAPLSRPVRQDEYRSLVRSVGAYFGGIDPASENPVQIMFWPTCCTDTSWAPKCYDGPWLDPSKPLPVTVDAPAVSVDMTPVDRVLSAVEGERNNVFNEVVFALARSGQLTDELSDELRMAARDIGLTGQEIEATFRSASRGGDSARDSEIKEVFGSVLRPGDPGFKPMRQGPQKQAPKQYKLSNAGVSSIYEPSELWRDMIPLGALTIFSGMGGIGKSTFDAYLAARVSRGDLDSDLDGPQNVLMILDEDDWNMDTVPRLMVAGADLSRVFKVTLMNGDEETDIPTFPEDFGALRQIIHENNIKLVILDVITSMVSYGIDVNKQTDVRHLLNPLLRIAQMENCAIIAVNHWRKASGNMSHMISGSAAFRDTARCVWGFVKTDDRRLVKIDKYNRSPKTGKTFEFDLASEKPLPSWKRTVAKVVNFRESDTDAQDALDQEAGAEVTRTGARAAAETLRDLLSDGLPRPWKEIERDMKENGFSAQEAKKAREHLKCVRENLHEGKPGRPRVAWALPTEVPELPPEEEQEPVHVRSPLSERSPGDVVLEFLSDNRLRPWDEVNAALLAEGFRPGRKHPLLDDEGQVRRTSAQFHGKSTHFFCLPPNGSRHPAEYIVDFLGDYEDHRWWSIKSNMEKLGFSPEDVQAGRTLLRETGRIHDTGYEVDAKKAVIRLAKDVEPICAPSKKNTNKNTKKDDNYDLRAEVRALWED